MNMTLLNAAALPAIYDGTFGFNDGTYDHLVGGWTAGSVSYKTHYRSADNGATWSAQADYAYEFHTAATAVVNNVAYIVGGDVFAPSMNGDWNRSSNKFESGAWSQISANCGIGDRCLMGFAYHEGDFYAVGGQSAINKTDAIHTVIKSTNNCASFTQIVADTRTIGFKGGNLWGCVVSYKGLLWKICGEVYYEGAALWRRESDTAIWTSPDGVTWTHACDFKGYGRGYPQCIVYNDKIWIFGGFHGNHFNLNEVWTIEKTTAGRIIQTYLGTADYGGRHAMAIWEGANGILMFGGSDNAVPNQDCWLITE